MCCCIWTRFNILIRSSKQTLLEFMENGSITLIASTTENPYFYVYNAILSRSTVFEFKPVEKEDVQRAVERAFRVLGEEQGPPGFVGGGRLRSHCLGLRRGRAKKP